MANVGVTVTAEEVPTASTVLYNTANAFMVGRADWGPFNTPTAITSLAQFASLFGTPATTGNPNSSRSTTCATAFDAMNTFFEEGPSNPTPIAYFSRVLHSTGTAASLITNDGSSNAALTFTANYGGAGGNAIYVAITNASTTYTISLQDANGNVFAASASLSTLAAGVAFCATTSLVTAVAGTHGLPATLSATALAGGTDNYSSVTITDYTTALTSFGPNLGPGQVLAPGITNTTLSGIWSALGTHASANNRVALCDMDDNISTSTAITDLSTFGTSANAGYCGFWAGNRNIPGVTPSTTRSVAPSSVIAALCARSDTSGNPNQPPAGPTYALQYANTPTSNVSGGTTDTYSLADLDTLNANGINAFKTFFGVPQNYGFVSVELSTTDQVYWQFNHARMRMAIIAQGQLIGQPYVFSLMDGQNSDAGALGTALDGMMDSWPTGALWLAAGQTTAYTVDVGPDINTVSTIAAGQLNANITTSFSYYAQNVQIVLNVVPITQAV